MTDQIEDALSQSKSPQPFQGSVEDALSAAQPPKSTGQSIGGYADYAWGGLNTYGSNILNAFNVGYKDAWGANKLSPESLEDSIIGSTPEGKKELEELRKSSWYKWSEAARNIIGDPFHFGAAYQSSQALIGGAISAANPTVAGIANLPGIRQGMEATAKAGLTGTPEQAGHTVSELGEYGLQRGDLPLHEFGPGEIPPHINTAKAEGVIGEANTEEQVVAKNEAIGNLPPTQTVNPKSTIDIHQEARAVAPDVFKEYDDLQAKQNVLKEQLFKTDEYIKGTPEVSAQWDKINTLLDRQEKNGKLGAKETEKLAQAYTDLYSLEEKAIPDSQTIKEQYLDNYNRLSELEPDVRSAYSQAAQRTSPDSVIPSSVNPSEEPASVGPSIASQVSKQLQKAGRTKEEANAIGLDEQAKYEVLAHRFGGKIGSAQDIFEKEFPEISNDSSKQSKGTTYAQNDTNQPTFYSVLSRGIENSKVTKAPASQWLSTIKNLQGIKQEELDWTGLQDWLKKQDGPVSKEDLQDYLKEHQVSVQEVEYKKNDPRFRTEDEEKEYQNLREELNRVGFLNFPSEKFNRLSQLDFKGSGTNFPKTKFDQYKLPGGENYRELLLTLPHPSDLPEGWGYKMADEDSRYQWEVVDTEGNTRGLGNTPQNAHEDALTGLNYGKEFRSSHWEEPNVLAHIRFDDRIGPNGEKTLHMAEIQSDWHQKGRREGYKEELSPNPQGWATAGPTTNRGKGVPDAPFKTSWHELALKRMLRYAVDNGYDKISWDTGETNADRFDLSKQISTIKYFSHTKTLDIFEKNGTTHRIEGIEPNKLDDHIGKEAADKLREKLNNGETLPKLENIDLKIGGEGMKGFYDKILPQFLNKYAKKWEGKVKDDKLTTENLSVNQLADNNWEIRNDAGQLARGFISKEEALKELSKYKVRQSEVHSLDITPEMKESVIKGQPLFQGQKQGSLTVRPGERNLIQIFKTANKSTILHELSHDWLERLTHYAEHPEAPEELKNDITIIQDWYNKNYRNWRFSNQKGWYLYNHAVPSKQSVFWKSGDPIPRGAHEMWARATERYFRDGLAPTPELKGVFDKFRKWLLGIYKSVKDLGNVPLDKDIRGVFDRIRTLDKEKTVIAPMESETALDGLIEAKEGAEGDERYVDTGHPPNGFQEAPEGTGEKVERPVIELEQSKTKDLVDKDGKFRIDQITNYSDLSKGIVSYISKKLNEIEARKGNLTKEDMIQLGANVGLDPRDVNLDRLNSLFGGQDVPLAGKVMALKQYMQDAMEGIKEALDNGDKATYVALRKNLVAASDIFLTRARPEFGYGGRALQLAYKQAEEANMLDQFFEEQAGQTFDQVSNSFNRMKAIAKKKGITVEELMRQLRDEAKPQRAKWITELLINNMLSGTFTHLHYFEINKVYALYRAYAGTTFEAASQKLINLFSKDGKPGITFGELKAITENLPHAQMEAAASFVNSMKLGKSQSVSLKQLAKDKVDYELANGMVTQKGYQNRLDNLIRNPTGEMVLASAPPKNILQSKSIPGLAGDIIRAPTERMVTPIHSEAFVFRYSLRLSQLIYREAVNKGLTGDALATEIARLKYDTPIDLIKDARHEALKATLLSNESDLAKHLSGLSNWTVGAKTEISKITGKPETTGGVQPLKPIAPFVSIPMEIFHQAVFDNTPLGIISRKIRDNALGKNGKVAQAEAVGNLMLGTAVMGSVYALMEMGIYNGPSPTDKHQALVQQRTSGYPYSLKIGNQAIPSERMGALGEAMAISADLLTASKHLMADTDKSGKSLELPDRFKHAAWLLVHSIGGHLTNMGPLTGFSNLFDMIRDENKMSQWGQKMVGLIDPAVSFQSQFARQIDPDQREAHGVIQQFMSQTPWLSEDLNPRYDRWGVPVPNERFVGTYLQQIHDDPIEQYFTRHPDFFPSNLRNDINGYHLSDDEFSEYQHKAGIYLKIYLNKLITPQFEQEPDILQKKQILAFTSMANHQAIVELHMKNPQIPVARTQMLTNLVKGNSN